MIRVFDAFRGASEFAANHCRANKCTAKLYRQDSGWAVKVDALTLPAEPRYPQIDDVPAKESESCRSEEQQETRPELSSKRDELLHLAKNGSLSHMQLSLVIDNARMYSFSEEDLTELRTILKKMCPPSDHSPVICPSCHMVGSNCTCGRSWF